MTRSLVHHTSQIYICQDQMRGWVVYSHDLGRRGITGKGDSTNSVNSDYENVIPFRVGGRISIGFEYLLVAMGVIFFTDVFDKASGESASNPSAVLANGKVLVFSRY